MTSDANSVRIVTADDLRVVAYSIMRKIVGGVTALLVSWMLRRKQRKKLRLPNPSVYRAKLAWNRKRRRKHA